MSAEGVEVAYQQISEADVGFHFLPTFCNFTPINRNSFDYETYLPHISTHNLLYEHTCTNIQS